MGKLHCGGREGGRGCFAGDLVMRLKMNSSGVRPRGGGVESSKEIQRERWGS